jgi:heme A synthase
MLETVLGPVWVWLVLNERPDAASLTGGALIFVALVANMAVDLVRPRAMLPLPGSMVTRRTEQP